MMPISKHTFGSAVLQCTYFPVLVPFTQTFRHRRSGKCSSPWMESWCRSSQMKSFQSILLPRYPQLSKHHQVSGHVLLAEQLDCCFPYNPKAIDRSMVQILLWMPCSVLPHCRARIHSKVLSFHKLFLRCSQIVPCSGTNVSNLTSSKRKLIGTRKAGV